MTRRTRLNCPPEGLEAFVEREVDECRFEEPLGVAEFLVGWLLAGADDFLGHPARPGDRHCEDDRRSQPHEVNAPDDLVGNAGPNHDGRVVAEVRQETGGCLEQLGKLQMYVGEERLDSRPGRRPKPARCAVVDVVAVPLIRWHSSGRRVRLGDESIGLEPREVIAHGCARDVEAAAIEYGLRADGLARADELLDEGLENPSPAVIKHRRKLALSWGE